MALGVGWVGGKGVAGGERRGRQRGGEGRRRFGVQEALPSSPPPPLPPSPPPKSRGIARALVDKEPGLDAHRVRRRRPAGRAIGRCEERRREGRARARSAPWGWSVLPCIVWCVRCACLVLCRCGARGGHTTHSTSTRADGEAAAGRRGLGFSGARAHTRVEGTKRRKRELSPLASLCVDEPPCDGGVGGAKKGAEERERRWSTNWDCCVRGWSGQVRGEGGAFLKRRSALSSCSLPSPFNLQTPTSSDPPRASSTPGDGNLGQFGPI
jgi:hypothetical protein